MFYLIWGFSSVNHCFWNQEVSWMSIICRFTPGLFCAIWASEVTTRIADSLFKCEIWGWWCFNCLPRLTSCSGSFPFATLRDVLFCTPYMMKWPKLNSVIFNWPGPITHQCCSQLKITPKGGKWPFWLSPRQCMVVPVSEDAFEYLGCFERVVFYKKRESKHVRAMIGDKIRQRGTEGAVFSSMVSWLDLFSKRW